jgi:hypothetical protein
MELEETSGEFVPQIDNRLRVPEPLPVRLVAVADVTMLAPPGIEAALDALYAGILRFERVPPTATEPLTYRAENFLLRFQVGDEKPVVHESLRPQGVEVESLGGVERALFDAEIEYTRQRGLTPGSETLLVLDPAGNWLEIGEIRRVM